MSTRFRFHIGMAVLILLLLTGIDQVWADTGLEAAIYSFPGSGQISRYTGLDYEPYSPGEFPEWAHQLRRYETIFFGSLPFAFLFTSLGFDFYAYAANNFDENYLPLFLGTSPEKEDFNNRTIGARIAVSISLSAVIAYIDYLIERKQDEASP